MGLLTCMGYIPGAGALPDMFTWLLASAWDITNMLHFLLFALSNLPSELRICSTYIVGDTLYYVLVKFVLAKKATLLA